MTSMQRVRRGSRFVAVIAFAVAAAAAPMYTVMSTPDAAAPQAKCLAWLGSKIDGKCISESSTGGAGQVGGGMPSVAVGGRNSGSPGFSTGPVLPGQTINIPVPVG